MRTIVWGMLATAALAVMALTATAATPEVEQLIEKMGSGKFKEREAACRELERIGTPALEALRKAARSEDADLSQRAKDVIKAIEKKADAAEVLQPTLVNLHYKDTPITKICQDLSQKTGYPILPQGDAKKLEGHLVTIETKEITFWEAIDLLCAKAELTHQTQAGVIPPGNPGGPPPLDGDVPPGGFRGRPGGPRPPMPGGNPGQIVLLDAKPASLPTANCGAIRVRAVPSAPFSDGLPLEPQEAMLAFEVVAEPKLHVLSLTIRLEKAVDDRNQMSEPTAMGLDPQVEPGADGVVIVNGNPIAINCNALVGGDNLQIGGNVKRIIEPEERYPRQQIVTAKVTLPGNGGKAIKEMQAVLVMQVISQSRIAVDDLAKAAGKSFRSRDGREVKIISVNKLDQGRTLIQLEVDGQRGADGFLSPPLPGGAGGKVIGPGVQDFAGQVAPADEPPLGPPDDLAPIGRPGRFDHLSEQFQASTKDGKPCAIVNQGVGLANNGGKAVTIYKITFQAPEKAAVDRLAVTIPKQTTIEVPFELKDVPVK